MPYSHTTAFGTSRGNLTDDERLGAQQAQFAQAQQAQMAALQAEIADRQAGRAFQGGQADKDRSFQGGMFDKSAGLQRDLDTGASVRAFGVADRQMGPAMSDANLRKQEADLEMPLKRMRNDAAQYALQTALDRFKGVSGNATAPASAAPAAVAGTPGGVVASAETSPVSKPSRGHLSEEDLMDMAMLSSMANGGGGADIIGAIGKRDERLQAAQLNALRMKELEGQLSDNDLKRQQARTDAEKTRRGEPLVPRAYAEVGVDPQIGSRIKRLTDIISNNNLYFDDENLNEVNTAFRDLTNLLDAIHASPEAKSRVLQDARDKMRTARQGAQGWWHGSGMGKLDGYIGSQEYP